MTTNDPTPRRWDVRLPDGRTQWWGFDPAKVGAEFTVISEWPPRTDGDAWAREYLDRPK